MTCHLSENRTKVVQQSKQVAKNIAMSNRVLTDTVINNNHVLEVNFRPITSDRTTAFRAATEFTRRFKKAYGTDISTKSRKDGSAYSIVNLTDDTMEELSNPSKYTQLQSNTTPDVAENTLENVKDLLKRLDIKIYDNLSEAGANGVANLLNRTIQVVKGQLGENALPEEAMHFIVAAIEQKYPELYKEMEDGIWKFNIYSQTLKDYKDNPLYQKNGKPDLKKLKQEAIAKLLTGLVINDDLNEDQKQVDVSKKWWSRIFDAIKQLFSKITGNPFEEDAFTKTAKKVFDKDFILPEDIHNLSQATSYLQLGTPKPDKQQALFDKLSNDMKSGSYKKVQTDKERYYEINGKRYFMSVTEFVKQSIEKEHRFSERTESQKFRDMFSREWGTAIDDTINTILDRYVDPTTGLIRTKPLPRPEKADGSFDLGATPLGKFEMDIKKFKGPTVAKIHMYDTLESFIHEFLKSFPPNTKFMWQVIVADTNAKKVLPGTIDFMAILPDATVKIFDWKSLDSEYFSIDEGKNKKKDDIAWFKKKAYDIQLSEYKKMFTNSNSVYARHLDTPVPGRNPQRFNIEVTESRAIPIAVSFIRKKVNPAIKAWDGNTIYDLDKINIGTPDWENPWRILKPVPTSDEKTYIKELDNLINKIDKIYNDLFNKRYTSKKDRDAKNRELNRLQEAKRDIQVNKNINSTLNALILTLNRLNKELNNSDFIQIRRNLGTLTALDGLKKSLEDVFSTISADRKRVETALALETNTDKINLLKEQLKAIAANEEIYDKLADVDTNINLLLDKYRERNKTQIGILAEKLGIHNIFAVQRQISIGLERLFNGKSENYIKTVQVFNKLLHEAQNSAKFEFKDVYDKLVISRNNLQKWAKQNNITLQEAVNKLVTEKSVIGEELKFVAKWKKEFYKSRDQAIEKLSGDDAALAEAVGWFIENTDFDLQGFEEEKAEKIDQINNEEFDIDPRLNAEARKLAIQEYIKKNNPYNEDGSINKEGFNKSNKFLQPKEYWKTEEYKYIEANKPLWEAHELFRNIVKDAEKAGLVERWLYTRTIPNMEGFISLGPEQFPGKLAMSLVKSLYKEDVPMYGIDELGHPVFNINTKYTKDLGVWKERAIEEDGKKKVQVYKDYSNVSKDLFSVFLNFAESAITTKNLQNIEDASLLLLDYEYNKSETIPTTIFGNTIEDKKSGKLRKEKIHPEDNKNADFLRSFILNDLYHTKEERDTALSKYSPSKFIENQIKKVNGGEEFLTTLQEKARHLSFKSLILMINSFNQLRILGFNFRAAGANLVVGMTNAWFESGRKYDFNDTLPPTTVEDLSKFFALVEYGLPGIEFKYSTKSKNGSPKIMGTFNEIRQEHGLLAALGQSDLQKAMYTLMRETDKAVQYSIYTALLRNYTIKNGELVHIADYVKQKETFTVGDKTVKYDDKLNLSASDRDSLEAQVAKKIADLKESSNLFKLVTIKEDTEGKPVASFEGLDRNSATVSNFRIQVQETIKDVLGSITEEDTSIIRMSWIGSILLTFKNWIPRQIRVRFGKFNYNSNKNAYDIGKHRLLTKHVMNTTFDKGKVKWGAIPKLIAELFGANYFFQQLGIIQKYGYDYAISEAYNDYANELLKRGDVETRQEANLEMPTLGEFSDLYEQKLSSSFKELRTILLLTSTLLAYNSLNDPSDESWWEIFLISTIKRTLYDVGFWQPGFWYNLFKKPFSFLGLFEDIGLLIKHGTLFLTSDSEKEGNLTRKYVMKVAPVTREYVNMRSMFDDEFRKKYDIQLKEYNW